MMMSWLKLKLILAVRSAGRNRSLLWSCSRVPSPLVLGVIAVEVGPWETSKKDNEWKNCLEMRRAAKEGLNVCSDLKGPTGETEPERHEWIQLNVITSNFQFCELVWAIQIYLLSSSAPLTRTSTICESEKHSVINSPCGALGLSLRSLAMMHKLISILCIFRLLVHYTEM